MPEESPGTPDRWFMLALVAFVFAVMIIGAVQYWLPRYLTDQFGLNLAQSGLKATIWIQSAAVVGFLVGGRWSDAWARRWMSGRSLVQLIGLAALGPALLVIGSGNSGPLLVAALIIFGVGTALYLVNLWASTFEVVSPRERATAIGLLNLSNGVSTSWVDPVIGRVADSGVGLGSIFSFLSFLDRCCRSSCFSGTSSTFFPEITVVGCNFGRLPSTEKFLADLKLDFQIWG